MIAWFDPMYLLVALPGLLLAGWASLKVRTAMAHASKISPSSGMTGAQAAARILQSCGLSNVSIEPTRGYLGDHYDPRKKVLRLSADVYQGRTLAAVGVAAHEAGHAIQDAKGYAPLGIRNAIVPMATFGSNAWMPLILIGFLFHSQGWILAGIAVFSLFVLFQLVNLPVEYNASARAKEVLVETGVVMRNELAPINGVLSAAALTYVAATITAVLQLLYFIMRYGSRD